MLSSGHGDYLEDPVTAVPSIPQLGEDPLLPLPPLPTFLAGPPSGPPQDLNTILLGGGGLAGGEEEKQKSKFPHLVWARLQTADQGCASISGGQAELYWWPRQFWRQIWITDKDDI